MPPRGRPKRRATEPDSTPAVRRRLTATTSPHDEQEEDGGASRWDTGRPANWPVATLLSRIADCGIKLPPVMKKAQVLRIYMDNCARGDTVDQLATGVSVYTNAPSLSTSPTTQWGITAELNNLASRARQRGQPTPAVTTSAAGISTSRAGVRVSPYEETLIRDDIRDGDDTGWRQPRDQRQGAAG